MAGRLTPNAIGATWKPWQSVVYVVSAVGFSSLACSNACASLFVRSFKTLVAVARYRFKNDVFQPCRNVRTITCGTNRLAKARCLKWLDFTVRGIFMVSSVVIKVTPAAWLSVEMSADLRAKQLWRHKAWRAWIAHGFRCADSGVECYP